jgi:hypothetical protein
MMKLPPGNMSTPTSLTESGERVANQFAPTFATRWYLAADTPSCANGASQEPA